MSRAIRVREGVLVRFIRRVLAAPQNIEKGVFTATDITLARDHWMDLATPDIPALSMPTTLIADALPQPELVLVAPGICKPVRASAINKTEVLEPIENHQPPSQRLGLPQEVSSLSDTIKIEELMASLKFCKIPVQEVAELPSGATRISIKSMFDGQQARNPEFEPVYRR